MTGLFFGFLMLCRPWLRFWAVLASRAGFAILLLAVVYLSWKPSPSFAQLPALPTGLGRWLDQHDFIKNLVGYGLLAWTGFLGWARTKPQYRSIPHVALRDSRRDFTLLAAFYLLVVVMELGQLVLPKRTCDWADVLAGWLGVTLAWAIFLPFRFALRGSRALLSQ